MRSIVGQCLCCYCEPPRFEYRSRNASKAQGAPYPLSQAAMRSEAVDALPAYGGWVLPTAPIPPPYGFAGNVCLMYTSGDPPTTVQKTQRYNITEVEYRIRFPILGLAASTGCYKVRWIERAVSGPVTGDASSCAITGGGTSISSVEVLHGGLGYDSAQARGFVSGGGLVVVDLTNYGNGYSVAPSVTISAPEAGGVQAVAYATLDAYGGVYSVVITNAGSGYLSITIALSPPSGATTPQVVIGPSSGVGATASATLAGDGSIASVSVDNAGSMYFQGTGASIVSPHGLGRGAVFIVHLGVETIREATWAGGDASGVSLLDRYTWLISDMTYELKVPSGEGVKEVEIVGFSCDVCD